MKDSNNGGFEAGYDEVPSSDDPNKVNVRVSLMETSESKNKEAGGNNGVLQIVKVSGTEEQSSMNVTTGDHGIRMSDSSEKEFYSLGMGAVADDQYMRILHSRPPHPKTKKIKSLKPKVHAASSPKALKSGTFKIGAASGGGGEHQCCCCFKKFPTLKSLCGHMKFHPQRNWKGIRPSDPNTGASSSKSEPRSDARDQEEDKDFLDLSADHEGERKEGSDVTSTIETVGNDNCDLTRFLPKWPRTGLRGENSLVLIDLPAQPHNTPMTLRLDRTILASDHIPMSALRKQDLSDKQKPLIRIEAVLDETPEFLFSEHVARRSQKIMMESTQQTESKSYSRLMIDRKGSNWGHASIAADASKSFSDRVPSKKATECNYENEHKLFVDLKQPNRNIEGNDQEMDMGMSMAMKMNWKSTPRGFEPQIQKKISKKPYEYICKTCNKTFPTFQALGGHRSSHNKDQNTKAVEPSIAIQQKKDDTDPTIKVEETREFGEHASLHICNLCYKSFPTGQALGGHKKRHWAAAQSAEARAPSSEAVVEDSRTDAALTFVQSIDGRSN
ncbi:hypothetical protein I3843_09G157600 [Carya illinoinensis]|nr:hypothetical protein I3843_09G157600 [Carya illinoinensis]